MARLTYKTEDGSWGLRGGAVDAAGGTAAEGVWGLGQAEGHGGAGRSDQ